LRRLLAAVVLLWGAAALGQAGALGRGLDGRPVERLAGAETRVVVLFFAATDCPISNRYVPEMMRLRALYGARHVAFWWVYPNAADTAEVVRAHEREFAMKGDAVLDDRQRLVRMAHARATPEVAVFRVSGGGLQEVYHGRVDDRYLSLGRERPAATEHDLEDAMVATLAGKTVARAVTEPVGCAIVPLGAGK
jgi:hypothetical protein